VTWLERELVARRFTFERFAGARRVFDVDDAIWLTSNNSFTEDIVKHTHGVIAGNSFLAAHYRAAGAKVWIVPTSVDTNVWKPAARQDHDWTIGWIGTSSNLKYLYSIEEPIADFLSEQHECRLLVVSDKRPQFKTMLRNDFNFVRWSAGTEVQQLQMMNVGLMPLFDTEWELGKCACKMLLYMAVGIPTIASPVGSNREILNEANIGYAAHNANDWYQAIKQLFINREHAQLLGCSGRQLVEDRYSVSANVHKLANIFLSVSHC
jgi:glycosyltransferase involved in cell wall biosynthesis